MNYCLIVYDPQFIDLEVSNSIQIRGTINYLNKFNKFKDTNNKYYYFYI